MVYNSSKRPIVIEVMKRISRFIPFITPYPGSPPLLLFWVYCLAAALLLPACRTTVAPRETHSSLIFEDIRAESPDLLTLLFSLEIENPLPFGGRVNIESWQVELNGRPAPLGFGLESGEGSFPIQAASRSSFPLELEMDMLTLVDMGLAPADNYEVNLVLFCEARGDSYPPLQIQVSCLAAFPGVRAPVFTITSIAILQAELINTCFRVGLRIDNPNPYPVELSAMHYELYGNGRLWAEGAESRIEHPAPAKGSLEGHLFLMMNFIGMSRSLLDQIIMLEYVNYRFAGEAKVSTGVEYLPAFVTEFNLSGYSEVLE